MRKVRYDYEVTVHVHAPMRPCGRTCAHTCHTCTHTRMWTAYCIPPLHVLGSRPARNSSGVILKNKPWDLVMPTLIC